MNRYDTVWKNPTAHYFVERSKEKSRDCGEFRCKKAIFNGDLCVGIADGAAMSKWFHCDCLKSSFFYRGRANKPISEAEKVAGFDKLSEADRETFRTVFQPAPKKSSGSVTLKLVTQMQLTGDTFDMKDELKQYGCNWDGNAKLWVCTDPAMQAKLCAKFGLELKDLAPGAAKTVPFGETAAAEDANGDDEVGEVKPKKPRTEEPKP